MSDSDVEIKKIARAPMKPVKKPPKSPTEDILKKEERKITTKAMIHEALVQLKTRKGVSIQAIKKFMEDKYNIETEKVKYLIKKTLKTGVEDGSIIQLKGIGASGSFKLAAVKEKPKSKKDKPKKEKASKEKSTKEKSKEPKEKKEKTKLKEMKATSKTEKTEKKVKMDVKSKEKPKKIMEKPTMKGKDMKDKKPKATPTKKKAMMKRKSIGTIIKPPKMKPKLKA